MSKIYFPTEVPFYIQKVFSLKQFYQTAYDMMFSLGELNTHGLYMYEKRILKIVSSVTEKSSLQKDFKRGLVFSLSNRIFSICTFPRCVMSCLRQFDFSHISLVTVTVHNSSMCQALITSHSICLKPQTFAKSPTCPCKNKLYYYIVNRLWQLHFSLTRKYYMFKCWIQFWKEQSNNTDGI